MEYVDCNCAHSRNMRNETVCLERYLPIKGPWGVGTLVGLPPPPPRNKVTGTNFKVAEKDMCDVLPVWGLVTPPGQPAAWPPEVIIQGVWVG
jgi:hypothetical protein